MSLSESVPPNDRVTVLEQIDRVVFRALHTGIDRGTIAPVRMCVDDNVHLTVRVVVHESVREGAHDPIRVATLNVLRSMCPKPL